jgi:hypothetical protein
MHGTMNVRFLSHSFHIYCHPDISCHRTLTYLDLLKVSFDEVKLQSNRNSIRCIRPSLFAARLVNDGKRFIGNIFLYFIYRV